ncbi:MAG: hypothetical protein KOO63_08345 [Bacteroidales bacterium]|nr:hypothetical protein [Candidatus Latescibacterota bacterium]
MSVISTQVLQDVIDEIQGEIDSRPEETESLADIERAENNVIDQQEHSHNARGRL